MERNNYFDDSNPLKPYTHSLDANPGSQPPANAVRGDMPDFGKGFWPCWDGTAWQLVEDHRGENGWVDGEPVTVAELGPLPANWSDTAPEPPFHPGPDYEKRGEDWWKVRYTKLDFIFWCGGLPLLNALNELVAQGNSVAKSIHDFLSFSEYISLKDNRTKDLVSLLTTSAVGNILTPEDAARVLAGEMYEAPDES